MSLFWTILTVVLALVEAATTQLITIWFSGGAFAALITSICGVNIFWQILIFIVASALLLILTKPVAKRIKAKSDTKTNVDALIGKIGVVTETINNIKEEGAVKLHAITWSARNLNEEIIEEGTIVEIVKIEGVKLIVKIKEV